MPLQNRVTPFGDILADPARGLFMGNRGILHDDRQRLGKARWRHRNWIICTLVPRGVPRTVMAPGRYTELFFLDEAVALAAGHRPCAECRRDAFRAFRAAWARGHGMATPPSAPTMDGALHAARLSLERRQRTVERAWDDLPDGAFVAEAGSAWLVQGPHLLRWSAGGYDAAAERPVAGRAEVLTPQPTLEVLKAGYRPVLHPTAER